MQNENGKLTVIGIFAILALATLFLINHTQLSTSSRNESNRIDAVEGYVTDLSGRIESLETSDPETALGASLEIPTSVALFETSLASKISSTATSMTLVSATDKTGTTLASSTYAFILDEGSASEEMVIADCTATACTNMVRGISPITGTSTVTALEHEHRRGASVKITDGPQLLLLSRILNGVGTVPNSLRYTTAPTFTYGNLQLVTWDKAKDYADSVALVSAPNADTRTKGVVQLSTGLQAASSTSLGSTGAALALPASLASTTPGSNATTTIVATKVNHKIDQSYLDLTEAFIFSTTSDYILNVGTLTATSSARLPSSLNWGAIAYTAPSSQGSAGSVLVNNGSGALSWGSPSRYMINYLSNVGAVTNGYATSSTVITVASGYIQASSTIEVKGRLVCSNGPASASPGSCYMYVRNGTTGAEFANVTLGAIASNSTQVPYVVDCVIWPTNGTLASETSECTVSGGADAGGGSFKGGVFQSIQGTDSTSLSGSIPLVITVRGDSANATIEFDSPSIEITQ